MLRIVVFHLPLHVMLLLVWQELEDIEVRLCHGGLGGVPDFGSWTKKLAAAVTVQDFVSFALL